LFFHTKDINPTRYGDGAAETVTGGIGLFVTGPPKLK
jgi:hypothetical protein